MLPTPQRLRSKTRTLLQHSNACITIKTEVIGSVEGIDNSVDVFVDGQYKGGDKTEIKDDLIAVTQYGSVVSAKAPEWAAAALKLVDGGMGETLQALSPSRLYRWMRTGTPSRADRALRRSTTPTEGSPSRASGDEGALSKTGDAAPIAPLVALAIGGLGLAVICVRRARGE